MALDLSSSNEATTLRLKSQRFDAFECAVLTVARYLFASLENADANPWHRAFNVSIERWGEGIGLPLAFKLSKLVQAIDDARMVRFQHIDPLDVNGRIFISPDEMQFLNALHHMRRDDTPNARNAIENLTLGMMDPHVIRAGLDFCHRFSNRASGMNSRPSKPNLTVIQ